MNDKYDSEYDNVHMIMYICIWLFAYFKDLKNE